MIKIINALKAISGTNAKIEYIQNLTLDERSLLLELLLAAMTPNVTYNFNDLSLTGERIYIVFFSSERSSSFEYNFNIGVQKAIDWYYDYLSRK